MSADSLLVSEVFGPTIQGEGPNSGRLAWFVRLGGCNLSCTWCDTPYTWDSERFRLRDELTLRSAADICAALPPGRLVVLTGGEPLLQQAQPGWTELVRRLRQGGAEINVETNGTIAPAGPGFADAVDLYVVSPKLAHAGPHRGHQDPALHPAWAALARDGRAALKIVCRSAGDVRRAVEMADAVGWPPGSLWVMPEGESAAALEGRWADIVNAAVSHGVNVTHRLHVLAWGAERGR